MRKLESSKNMKAEPNRLIPRKPIENLLELLIASKALTFGAYLVLIYGTCINAISSPLLK